MRSWRTRVGFRRRLRAEEPLEAKQRGQAVKGQCEVLTQRQGPRETASEARSLTALNDMTGAGDEDEARS